MRSSRFLPAGALASGLWFGLAGVATAEIGPWVDGGMARVRLIAAGVDDGAHLEAAIEVDLPPGWKTYWRSPGDAGIPPLFDFSRSTNIAEPVVAYPVPHRFDDGYGISNVYEGRVVLPFAAAVADPSRPIDLRLSLDIGVCEIVCIPEHYDLDLSLVAAATDAKAARIISRARADLPSPAEPGVLDVERIVRSGGTDKRPEFDVTIRAPGSVDAEVFVEGPADWYAGPAERVDTDGGKATYRVRFSRMGAESPIGGANFRVTIVAGNRAVEQAVVLDGPR